MPLSGFALPEKDGVIDLDIGKNSLNYTNVIFYTFNKAQ